MSIYSDINTSKTEKFPLVTDVDAVWQAFENFIKTNEKERFFRPALGSPFRKDLLFELAYEDAVLLALTRLVDAIEVWDPRIEIDEGATQINIDYENKKVKMDIVFSVKGFSNQAIKRSITI